MEKLTIKHYQNLKQIGRGSHGRVYKAYDPIKNRNVAIKEAVKRIKDAEHEATVMKAYGKSPFLPTIYDYFEFKNTSFIVMEYIEGKPVGKGDFKRPSEKKDEKLSVQITINTLKSLTSIHKGGYIHNDIRPKNIMLQNDNPATLKVIDFTLAKELSPKHLIQTDLRDAARLCIFLCHGYFPDSLTELQFKNDKLQSTLLNFLHPSNETYDQSSDFIAALQPFV
ncbi:protein kinase domain-containing protein [Virgibacillus halodenitrificans]|uniref:protein kinase domain-containing protein n=1 Tax=Virgibacillus halodenitrificans TaxID=1482 RepID=UPI00311E4DC0